MILIIPPGPVVQYLRSVSALPSPGRVSAMLAPLVDGDVDVVVVGGVGLPQDVGDPEAPGLVLDVVVDLVAEGCVGSDHDVDGPA